MRYLTGLVAACSLFLSTAFGASAEVTQNSSSLSDGDVNAQIVTMLGQEISALRRANTGRLGELASIAPKKVRRGWFFGRRKNDPVGNFRYSKASLARLSVVPGGKQWECLSEALYFEARGESVKGQFGVAEVILNRVDSRSFPNTVCKVVNQGTGNGKYRCQFSYNCDGKSERISEPKAYQRVAKIATIMLNGEPRVLTKGATYYHTTSVNPSWAKKFDQTALIGVHKFYRDNRRLTSN